jgi:hypothetical protein
MLVKYAVFVDNSSRFDKGVCLTRSSVYVNDSRKFWPMRPFDLGTFERRFDGFALSKESPRSGAMQSDIISGNPGMSWWV